MFFYILRFSTNFIFFVKTTKQVSSMWMNDLEFFFTKLSVFPFEVFNPKWNYLLKENFNYSLLTIAMNHHPSGDNQHFCMSRSIRHTLQMKRDLMGGIINANIKHCLQARDWMMKEREESRMPTACPRDADDADVEWVSERRDTPTRMKLEYRLETDLKPLIRGKDDVSWTQHMQILLSDPRHLRDVLWILKRLFEIYHKSLTFWQ